MADTWPKYAVVKPDGSPYFDKGTPPEECGPFMFLPEHFKQANIEPFFDEYGNPKVDRCKAVLRSWNKEAELRQTDYRYLLIEQPQDSPALRPEYVDFW